MKNATKMILSVLLGGAMFMACGGPEGQQAMAIDESAMAQVQENSCPPPFKERGGGNGPLAFFDHNEDGKVCCKRNEGEGGNAPIGPDGLTCTDN